MTNHVREMSKIKMSKQLHGPMGEFKGNPGKVMFSTASAINYSCIQFLPFYVEDTEEDKGKDKDKEDNYCTKIFSDLQLRNLNFKAKSESKKK